MISASESRPFRIVLISTYDLGRQPFGLASPAAWLRRAGFEVDCLDLAVDPLDQGLIHAADLVAFHLPMHTATRLAARIVPPVRAINPAARLCFYGLYAPMNRSHLRELGADHVLGAEFEADLVALAEALRATPSPGPDGGGPGSIGPAAAGGLPRLDFLRPDRGGLPALTRYAHLHDPAGKLRTVGATEASRGCKHRCRHCPIVPVYDGRFRIVQREVVLDDIRQQVAAGAEHITFGDPDFWNGIGHAMPLVESLHREFPDVTYDVTIKIEHLLRHRGHLDALKRTGCLFVTSAVESIDDRTLALLEKHHTRADFVEVVGLCRAAGLTLNPTFVAFTPWVTAHGYAELLSALARLDLIEHVAPIQLAIRLLIPSGSRLLELPEVRSLVGSFDRGALVHPWKHPIPGVDALQRQVQAMVEQAAASGLARAEIFGRARALASDATGERLPVAIEARPARARVPYLTEPWYC